MAVFSEILRDAEDQVSDDSVESIYQFYQTEDERDAILEAACHILESHLTIGTPDSFFEQRVGAYVINADSYLSDREQKEYTEGLKAPFPDSHDVIDDINKAWEKDSTLLTFAAKPAEETSEAAGSAGARSPWIVGTLYYTEPKDRMIGPEAKADSPTKFATEFMDRGGLFLVLDVPKRFRKRVVAAINYIEDSIEPTDSNDRERE